MVNALGDRWSYYIPASEYAAYQEQMKNAYKAAAEIIEQFDLIIYEQFFFLGKILFIFYFIKLLK